MKNFTLIFIFLIFGLTAFAQDSNSENSQNVPLKILKRPNASYTNEARVNGIEGNVTLRVTFLENGKIGEIEYIEESSPKKLLTRYGLRNKAIAVAKKIKFNPEIKDGKPVTVKRNLQFRFTIY